MLVRALAVSLVFTIAVAPIAYASSKKELQETEQKIKESRKRQAELAREAQKLESELSDLQERLVDAVAEIQKVEKDLTDTEQKLGAVARQIAQKKEQIAKNKDRLEGMVSAALRFSRMPVEAMVMMPGDTKERMRVSRALKMLSEDIRSETEALSLQMSELSAMEARLMVHKEAAVIQKRIMEAGRQALDAQLAERRRLHEKLNTDHDREAKAAVALAKKATGLKELVDTLVEEERRRQTRKDKGGWVSEAARKGAVRSFTRAKGRIRAPVAGVVKERFGEMIKGLPSKGVSLEARSQSEVVAPYDGEVIFSGPFLAYGKMIIIKHSDGFHTLLAGLGQIDVRPGEFLLEGEPIGAMGSKSTRPRLYVELRKNNQPVNPAPWIDGL